VYYSKVYYIDNKKQEQAVSTITPNPSKEILNSWKEIAIYLNRGVRTVQRWEAELGMPVRRPRGKRHSAVIATRTELDEWVASSPLTEKGNGVDGESKFLFDHGSLRFLLTEIESGFTFAHLAASAALDQVEKIQRNLKNARKAYSAVLRFRERTTLDEVENLQLNADLERLKAVLDGLESSRAS
jgi:hypothetical protein